MSEQAHQSNPSIQSSQSNHSNRSQHESSNSKKGKRKHKDRYNVNNSLNSGNQESEFIENNQHSDHQHNPSHQNQHSHQHFQKHHKHEHDKKKNTHKPIISLEKRNELNSIKETELNNFNCIICANPIDYCTINENCFHGDNDLVCWKCSLYLRKKMNDKRCCICKVESDYVIYSDTKPNSNSGYSGYNLNQLRKISEINCYVTKPYMISHIKSFFDIYCIKCGENFDKLQQLKTHMKDTHSLYYCDVCLEGRKVVLKDQKLYTFNDLKYHKDNGEEDEFSGKIGPHPECLFCNKRLYNDEELFFHMYHSHEKCHICESKGHKFEFFHNYSMLQIHFDQYHFRCIYPQCSHFVVFDNQLQLNHHILNEHSADLSRKDKERLKSVSPSELSSTSSTQNADNARLSQFQNVDSSIIRFMSIKGENIYLGDYQKAHRYSIKSHQNEENEKIKQSQISSQTGSQLISGGTVSYQPQRRVPGAFSNSRVLENLENKEIEEKKEKMKKFSNKIHSILGDRKFNQFQELTQNYQKDLIKASEFYSNFFELFGNLEEELFEEFIACLPKNENQRIEALKFARNTFHTKEYQHIREQQKNEKTEQKNIQNQPTNNNKLSNKKEKKNNTISLSEEQWPTLSNGTISSVSLWVGSQLGNNTTKKNKKSKNMETEDFPALSSTLDGIPIVPPPQPVDQWSNINARVIISKRGRRRH